VVPSIIEISLVS